MSAVVETRQHWHHQIDGMVAPMWFVIQFYVAAVRETVVVELCRHVRKLETTV
jgi:hypothetical protein